MTVFLLVWVAFGVGVVAAESRYGAVQFPTVAGWILSAAVNILLGPVGFLLESGFCSECGELACIKVCGRVVHWTSGHGPREGG